MITAAAGGIRISSFFFFVFILVPVAKKADIVEDGMSPHTSDQFLGIHDGTRNQSYMRCALGPARAKDTSTLIGCRRLPLNHIIANYHKVNRGSTFHLVPLWTLRTPGLIENVLTYGALASFGLNVQ